MSNFFTSRFATLGNYFETQRFAWVDLKNLFSWNYWSETGLTPQTQYGLTTFLVVMALIIGLVFWRRRLKAAQTSVPIYDGPINQLANIVAFIIIMTISYAFFRSQAITYLSSRLVILASLVVIVGWIGWVAFYQRRIAPAKRRDYLERERFFRYIPKRKEKFPHKK